MNTRDQIVETADQLFYEQGFELTSFAHIAKQLGISRGNFYHHFKTKDQILEAVIQKRLTDREQLLFKWEDQHDDPTERIILFTRILIVNQDKIMRFGCPVGTLSSELNKFDHPMSQQACNVMKLFADWLTCQFLKSGVGQEQANQCALHVLAWSQGVATLANAFKNSDFVNREVAEIETWIRHKTQSLTTKNNSQKGA